MDNTRVKFDQLKSEILQYYNDTNQMIKLTNELSCACEKYSKVKDLFWKVKKDPFPFEKRLDKEFFFFA